MKCISNKTIQKYIDNEISASKKSSIEKHLSECKICSEKMNNMKSLSVNAKQAIGSLNINNIEIPTFNYSKAQNKQRKIKYIIYSLSAACIIFFIFIFVDKKQEPCTETYSIVQSITWEADANQPFTNQNFAIEINDGKGNNTIIYLE
ncbi:MAG TPA: zf-HC2 domain-containing protein [Prolixibacteraceae bacterium]|nr:zf-HC2 domain-containing protein [Prolixibacteraceae bacterium]